MNTSYKEDHVKFVSDHEGTSVLEISFVSSIAPLGCLLRNVLLNWIAGSKGSPPKWVTFSVDFVTLIFIVMCAFTILSGLLEVFFMVIAVTIACLLMCTEKINSELNSNVKRNFNFTKLLNRIMSGKRPYLLNWRANVLVATAIVILAVDFVIFPRRYCKAETFGSGLMDIGVGAFVLSNAIVSPEARNKHHGSVGGIVKAIKSSIPLWVLGIARVLSVKSIDYHEHTSEYGVHWNFFFTLAVVRVCATIVFTFFSPDFSWFLSISTICLYQYLQEGPAQLKKFILFGSDGKGSRDGLLNANREGIFSCFGYLAIYFAGVQLGKYLLKPRYFLKDWLRVLLTLCVAEVVFCTMLYYSEEFVDPISRRLANLPYMLLVMQFNCLLLAEFLLVDILDVCFKESGILIQRTKDAEDSTSFSLLEAMNRNGLFYFLLANLLTGVVNLTVPTIKVSSLVAFTIVYMYLLLLSCIVTVLHIKNITVKFW